MGQAQAMGYRGGAKDRRVGAVEPRWRLEPPAAAGKPLFSVKRGAPIVLGFVNRTSYPQTMHVRGHVMRLLHNLDDGWEPYWRDAVITPAGKTSRVAFLAENPGRWLIENADPERAAAGLSAWFEVS
jgi:FtsP/CotA-like multicopper oxidase with cupredoxin domain